jgi:hypothetical protein
VTNNNPKTKEDKIIKDFWNLFEDIKSTNKRVKERKDIDKFIEKLTYEDIDDMIMDTLVWADKQIGCQGCKSQGKEEHSPACLAMHTVTTHRGKKGRVVLLNPHPSV